MSSCNPCTSKTFLIGLLILLASSCGPSADQIAKEKQALIDSTQHAIKDSIQQKLEADMTEQAKIESEKNLQLKIEGDKKAIMSNLVDLESKLEVEKSHLQTAKEYQMLRTQAEKDQQIKTYSARITQITFQIDQLRTTLEKINRNESYDMPNLSENSADTTAKF